ncbi:MAG TPA: hypothetical protein PKH29_12155, partial [Oscillospiraceae bacterium]|nr:hypothetical protein [Oscillospiraceae bacterium]
ANENVAFCVDNYQIYGKARNIGTWDAHGDILEEYKKIHTASYEKYKNVSDEIIVETTIEEIKTWEYRDGKPVIVRMNLETNEYNVMEYRLD